ncbi:MAG: hypothetical protein CL868_05010 [Cytophagaceae bacterium]|nr:hypothetical protein [Cytophagaceae bacterium]
MRKITAVIGVVLIGLGVYQAFVPQEVLSFGGLEVTAKEGITTETIIIIALGLLALFASFYRKK